MVKSIFIPDLLVLMRNNTLFFLIHQTFFKKIFFKAILLRFQVGVYTLICALI